MKLGFGIPVIGPAVSSAVGLSAFCRGIEDLGYDSLWGADRLVTRSPHHRRKTGKT